MFAGFVTSNLVGLLSCRMRVNQGNDILYGVHPIHVRRPCHSLARTHWTSWWSAGHCRRVPVWDASLRGLRAGLIERSDFASGTSAHSLRVLHGGIRYLQHLDIARLRESCAERGAFLRIAPHLTRPMPFALPTYGMGLRGKLPFGPPLRCSMY